MKKMYFALLMLGLVLTSCGGTAYTTDKDEALELAQEILDEEKEAYKEYLDYAKEVKEKKDKILKEYSGKESKLMKKAKKGDEDALSALKELRNLDINSEEKYEDMGKSLQKKQRAYTLSISDIRALNDAAHCLRLLSCHSPDRAQYSRLLGINRFFVVLKILATSGFWTKYEGELDLSLAPHGR